MRKGTGIAFVLATVTGIAFVLSTLAIVAVPACSLIHHTPTPTPAPTETPTPQPTGIPMVGGYVYLEDGDITCKNLIRFLTPATVQEQIEEVTPTPAPAPTAAEPAPEPEATSTPRKVLHHFEKKCDHYRQELRKGTEPAPQALVALDLQFRPGSGQFADDSDKYVAELSCALNSKDLKGYCFEIQGFVASSGDDVRDRGISQWRAESVVESLVHSDVPKERLISKGYGAGHPIADNATAAGRKKNGRMQIVNLGK